MTMTRFFLCAVPAPIWTQPANQHGFGPDITHFATDALGCERRIAKEVNLEDERSRYRLCCQRLENEVVLNGRLHLVKDLGDFQSLLANKELPVLSLGPGYLELLARAQDAPGPERLGAGFFPPDKVEAHQAAFAQWTTQQGFAEERAVKQRLAFLAAAARANCGVVEFQTACRNEPEQERPEVGVAERAVRNPELEKFVEIPEFATDGLAIEFFGVTGKKQHLARNLRAQIRQSLQSREPVSFGNQAPHDVITEVLREYVFLPESKTYPPADLRVVYADGSEARPFPLFCLPWPAGSLPSQSAPLRVALMSMRHLELDREIDFCWFRNRDVSRTRTLSETDEFCYQSTLMQLHDSLASGAMVMHLYHTGFEPAVIGFYRGVAHTLRELYTRGDRARLVVVPFYYRGGTNYVPGSEWS